MTPPNALHKRAAAMVWAEFRAYILGTGRDYDEVYATIAHGEMGMGDWCDDNMIVADVLMSVGLIADDCPDINSDQEVRDWNRVQECIYVHTGVSL